MLPRQIAQPPDIDPQPRVPAAGLQGLVERLGGGREASLLHFEAREGVKAALAGRRREIRRPEPAARIAEIALEQLGFPDQRGHFVRRRARFQTLARGYLGGDAVAARESLGGGGKAVHPRRGRNRAAQGERDEEEPLDSQVRPEGHTA